MELGLLLSLTLILCPSFSSTPAIPPPFTRRRRVQPSPSTLCLAHLTFTLFHSLYCPGGSILALVPEVSQTSICFLGGFPVICHKSLQRPQCLKNNIEPNSHRPLSVQFSHVFSPAKACHVHACMYVHVNTYILLTYRP